MGAIGGDVLYVGEEEQKLLANVARRKPSLLRYSPIMTRAVLAGTISQPPLASLGEKVREVGTVLDMVVWLWGL